VPEKVCIVGPCQAPRGEGSQYCPKHEPSRGWRAPPARSNRPKAQSTCPRCGGTNLVPRRKTSTKVFLGPVSLLGRPKHAECASCGYQIRRPN